MTRKKVVLGLSGGVDSAVAAHKLRQDFDVIALYLRLGPEAVGEQEASAVAKALDIPFYTMDISASLNQWVKQPFIRDYCAGKTPLPCAHCNVHVKFPALLALADQLDTAFIATGHYARVSRETPDRVLLKKGRPANDQSYLLARLPRDMLPRILFPLGDLEKTEVRAYAQSHALSVANKPDSMEICFIPDGDYATWLEQQNVSNIPPKGDFLDPEGHVLGQHQGIHHYTLGQGRGLGISGPHRYYVSQIDVQKNTITLSDGSDLGRTHILCDCPNWIAFTQLHRPVHANARFRHTHTETPCTIFPREDGSLEVETHIPVRAPSPGQLAVFYQADTVLGSAWIQSAC